MSLETSRRRSRRELEHDGDEDATRYSPQEQEGPKRRRRKATVDEDGNDEGDHVSESDASGDPNTQHHNKGVNGTNVAEGDADDDVFHPGSIRRVKLENFVTYKKAEFFPGPSLNMVLGPNGTGKSSLVCAICLGLGYSPKLMGRATSAKEFVKNGAQVATVEIELQRRPQDRANHVVRVQIHRDRNSQAWWLNGKETTHKTIQKLMRVLHVQIDNLCQFLPQDRVVEFAGLTPVELLHETLRAAAPAEVLTWQRELQDLHRDQKELDQQSGSRAETLGNLEKRQQAMQADVDRNREREEAETRIQDLRMARQIVAYQEARLAYSETQRDLSDAQQRLEQLRDESDPSLRAVREKQDYDAAVSAVVQARHAAVRAAEQDADKLLSKVDNAKDDVSQKQAQIEAEKQTFDVKKREMGKINRTIGDLENKLKNKPDEFDPKQHNQKIRAEEHLLRELEAEHRRLEATAKEIHQRGKGARDEKAALARELQEFDTQQGQQLKLIEKSNADVVKGWKWLQENGDKFQDEVFGPPLLTCTVKDKRYSNHVQALLQSDDFLCFTTQSREDHRTLSEFFYKELRLSVSIRTCLTSFSSFPKFSPEEASSMGFDAFAIDCLMGPEPVLAMLCAEKKLHLAGVALGDVDEGQYNRLMEEEKVSNWATGQQLYRVTRRKELGPSAVSTMTRPILPGRWWKDEVDAMEKQDVQRRLEEANQAFLDLKEEYGKVNKEKEQNEEQQSSKTEKIDDMKGQKKALQLEYNSYQALPMKLENEKQAQTKKKEELEATRSTMIDLEDNLDKAIVKKARAAVEHQQSIESIRDAQHALTEALMREIEAKSDLTGLKGRNMAIMQKLDEEKKKIVDLEQVKRQRRNEASVLKAEATKILETKDKDYLAKFVGEKSTTEVDEDIQAEEAKLELIHAANPNVLRDFEKRAREIEKLREQMETAQNKDDHLKREIARIREKFEPEVDELISKVNEAFAYNFEQISCAGEVRVHKDDDFDQWALQILVKFRENETLQQLNQQRQSGGERAVSTVFFLMALQAMAQAPFRVVDEINQGMDPRNERMVHHRMVDIACREHTSQYFLITPKLLPGLRYDERMRVLCIASGEHMPSDGKKLDFQRCLQVHKRSAGVSA